MNIPAPLRILLVGALCIAALIALVVRESMARASGTEIILRMEAIDPRSLLSGHYVILNFQQSLEEGAACPPIPTDSAELAFAPRRDAWVAFAPAPGHHRVAGAAETRTEAAAFAPIVTRGSAFCTSPRPATDNDPGAAGIVTADIGVDRFYVNQTEAQRIERLLFAQRAENPTVSAIVSIGTDGRARLKGLLVEANGSN